MDSGQRKFRCSFQNQLLEESDFASKTFLHMLEFSWWRGYSLPAKSSAFPLLAVYRLPDGRLSYLVTSLL